MKRMRTRRNEPDIFVLAIVYLCLAIGIPVNANNSFAYNNDGECTTPFEATIESISCGGNNYVKQYNDPSVCSFGDSMLMVGSFSLNQRVQRYFGLTLEVCSYGSTHMYYKPRRCKTYHRSIDMRKYALMVEEGEEEDFNEGYNLKSYWQDEERAQWYAERQQAMEQQAAEEELYLYAGTYSFNLMVGIASKFFPFGNGTCFEGVMLLLSWILCFIPHRVIIFVTETQDHSSK